MTQQQLNALSSQIINAAIEVHKTLGPGLLEIIYEECLAEELQTAGHAVQRQVDVPILYKGKQLGQPLTLDMVVDDAIIVELKAVNQIHDIHIAQLLTYLKLTDRRLGLLINFNVARLSDGIRRVVNHF